MEVMKKNIHFLLQMQKEDLMIKIQKLMMEDLMIMIMKDRMEKRKAIKEEIQQNYSLYAFSAY